MQCAHSFDKLVIAQARPHKQKHGGGLSPCLQLSICVRLKYFHISFKIFLIKLLFVVMILKGSSNQTESRIMTANAAR